jgi:hypothetical protein
MKTKFVVATFALVSLVLGCELIVDFDRTKIPQPVTDSGVADVVQPPADTGAPDTGADAGNDARPDAAPDAGDRDAAPDADVDASDGG